MLCLSGQAGPGAPFERVDMANAPTALSLNYVPCARDVAYFSALSKDVTPADRETERATETATETKSKRQS